MGLKRLVLRIVLAAAALVLVGAAYVFLFPRLSPHSGVVRLSDGTAIAVEVMADPASRAKGLSGRPYLAADRGMLFVFGQKNRPVFWMKGMNFPIDLVWIAEGRVVGITARAAVPKPGELARYLPPEPVDMVLEVAAGFCERRGLQERDRLDIAY